MNTTHKIWRGGDKNLESARDVQTDSGLIGKIFMHSRTVDEGTQSDGLGGVERYRYEDMLMAEMGHVSTLRGASRTIGGIAGDELVERVSGDNSATVFNFWWEVNGTEDNVFIPHLSFTMDTGKGNHGPIPSSLSEDVALRLWDKISSSIRVRPSVAANAIPTQARLTPASASSPDRAPPPR